jgi:hypothetical protein
MTCPHCGIPQDEQSRRNSATLKAQYEKQEKTSSQRRQSHPLFWPTIALTTLIMGTILIVYFKQGGAKKAPEMVRKLKDIPKVAKDMRPLIKHIPGAEKLGIAPSDENQSQSRLRDEPNPRPIADKRVSVRIADASLSSENDGDGHEQAIGRVVIENRGHYRVTDFRLLLSVNGSEYALAPYEGTRAHPTPISHFERAIPPGGRLSIPVMTPGWYRSYSTHGSKTVIMEATIDGPPGVLTDEVRLD